MEKIASVLLEERERRERKKLSITAKWEYYRNLSQKSWNCRRGDSSLTIRQWNFGVVCRMFAGSLEVPLTPNIVKAKVKDFIQKLEIFIDNVMGFAIFGGRFL